MARFRFSMQNLLHIKEQLENQRKMEYAAAQEQVRRQQEKLEQLKRSKEELFEQGRKLRQTTLDFLAIKENDASLVTGRLSNNTLVHFPGDASLIGQIVNVSLDECHGFYYMGHMI